MASPSLQQSTASDPASSVWVTASAGTGKTTVLTQRVLRLLLNGTPAQRILCLTYTKAAAAEMKQRINDTLLRWAIIDDDALSKELTDLLQQKPATTMLRMARSLFAEIVDHFENLKIYTIHSFCQSILKRFSIEAEVNPHFEVIDDIQQKELMEEAKLQLFSGAETEEVWAAIHLISEQMSDDTIDHIFSTIISERDKIQHLLAGQNIDAISAETARRLGITEISSLSDIIRRYHESSHRELSQLRAYFSEGSDADKENAETISQWLARQNEETFFQMMNIFLTGKQEPRKKLVSAGLARSFPEAETLARQQQEQCLKNVDYINALKCLGLTTGLLHIAESLFYLYESQKQRRGLKDYHDLIHDCLRLFEDSSNASWIMYKLDGGIDHILVDEAQDNSLQQWRIIQALCDEFFAGESASDIERTLFVVGDEKQSIFGFQGAAPERFQAMHEHFSLSAREAQKSWQSVMLDTSYRSAEAILSLVDHVFSNPDLREAITPQAGVTHHASRAFAPGRVELWPLTTGDEKDAVTDEGSSQETADNGAWVLPVVQQQSSSAKAILARTLATTIKRWLDEGRPLASKKNTAITPGDILVLVQKRDVFVTLLVKYLKEAGVPVAGVDRMKLTEHIAVMDLIALSHFLLMPGDDLNLAAALKSPLFGLNDDELFALAYDRGNNSLWESLQKKSAATPHFQNACATLIDLLNRADQTSPFELFSYILDAQFGRKLTVSRLGPDANDPLNEFLNLTLSYEKIHIPSLQGFLQWLEESDLEIKRDSEQGGNVVKIMTIHGAKGLQAPVVILPDTALGDGKPPKLLWDEDGFVYWPGKKDDYSNLCHRLLEDKQRAEWKERCRLLYVALTRAQDELYICGIQGKKQKNDSLRRWHDIVQHSMQAIGVARSDGSFLLECHADKTIPAAPEKAVTFHTPAIPQFLVTKALAEEVETTITPTDTDETTGNSLAFHSHEAAKRGVIIHRLLEILPEIEQKKQWDIAETFLQRHYGADKSAIEKTLNQLFAITHRPEFQSLFSGNSRPEVGLAGQIEGKNVSGRVDRLVVQENEVLVVDYKTHQDPPAHTRDIPPQYHVQMECYRQLLKQIYPEKSVRCFLLWTAGPSLMEIL